MYLQGTMAKHLFSLKPFRRLGTEAHEGKENRPHADT